MKDKAKEEQLIEDARKFPELASMFEEMRGILEEFELHEEEAERRDRAEEEAEKKADEARAEKARAGELGPKWQEIQKRIDQGKTTLLHIACQRALICIGSTGRTGHLSKPDLTLGRIHDQWAKEAEEEDAENPLTQMRAAWEAHEERIRSLNNDLDVFPSWPDRN